MADMLALGGGGHTGQAEPEHSKRQCTDRHDYMSILNHSPNNAGSDSFTSQ